MSRLGQKATFEEGPVLARSGRWCRQGFGDDQKRPLRPTGQDEGGQTNKHRLSVDL